MTLVLLKWKGKMLIDWLSVQFWVCCSCIYDLIYWEGRRWNHCERHTCFSMCVVNSICAIHPHRDMQNINDAYLKCFFLISGCKRSSQWKTFRKPVCKQSLFLQFMVTIVVKKWHTSNVYFCKCTRYRLIININGTLLFFLFHFPYYCLQYSSLFLPLCVFCGFIRSPCEENLSILCCANVQWQSWSFVWATSSFVIGCWKDDIVLG